MRVMVAVLFPEVRNSDRTGRYGDSYVETFVQQWTSVIWNNESSSFQPILNDPEYQNIKNTNFNPKISTQ